MSLFEREDTTKEKEKRVWARAISVLSPCLCQSQEIENWIAYTYQREGICDRIDHDQAMNLFRGRRSSLGNNGLKDEAEGGSGSSGLFGRAGGSAAASICRVFMPRSRTSCNLGATNACAGSAAAVTVGNNGAASAAAASTDWAYVESQACGPCPAYTSALKSLSSLFSSQSSHF